jgi:hypothetical protein
MLFGTFIKIGNKYFDIVGQFKYLGTTLTNQNFFREEIKSRLNSGNASYNYAEYFALQFAIQKKYILRYTELHE